ncbi:unnamed protein product [marine sediment metagenome]|uniref:Uncharacterized protein n=1 Tax=marine sediment metagenome TaxID=412755 RepID=X1JV17_9ZZZZ
MLESGAAKNFTEANKRALRKVIRKAKKMTKGIIGVNIMVALSDFYDMVLQQRQHQARDYSFFASIEI